MRISCYEKKHNKGSWTKQEDQKLIDYIKIHGEGCWSTLPEAAGLQRCGKSCRLRWMNYLRPDIKRGNFCLDEEDLIIKLHALLGNRWSLIAGRLPGRTDNEVKNYWNSHIKRKLISAGIDPKNHRVDQKLLHNSCTASENHHQPENTSTDAYKSSSHVSRQDKSDDDQSFDFSSSIGDDDEAVSSTELNLDLNIAFPSSSPPPLTMVKKKQDVSDDQSMG